MKGLEGFEYPVYLTWLAEGSLRDGRSAREEAGVQRLLCSVFGREAVRGHDVSGRPWLSVKGIRQDVNISISHCRKAAVLTVAPAGVDIGVDIEEGREQLVRVAPRVLSGEELATYGGSQEGLLRAWTLKEALYKGARHLLRHEPVFACQLVLPLGDQGAYVREDECVWRFETRTLVYEGLCIALAWRRGR